MIRAFFKNKNLISLLVILFLAACYGPVSSTTSQKQRAIDEKGKKSPETVEEWAHQSLKDLGEVAKVGDEFDPNAGLSRQDYHDLFNPGKKPLEPKKKDSGKLPDVSDLLVEPTAPVVQDDKLVTFSVTDDVPLKDVLIELSRRAGVDMEVDPEIKGGIILSAYDRPFSEVIQRIAAQANLRHSFENGVLKIERDSPYVINYNVSMLNTVRAATGKIKTSTVVGSSNSTTTATGSDSEITSESKLGSDLWDTMRWGIENILAQFKVSKSESSTSSSAAAAPPAAGEAAKTAESETKSGSSTETGIASSYGGSSILSINRQAGIISVLATQKQHKAIKSYLDNVQMAYTSQVLIEAKVMEVTLTDEYKSGINWNLGAKKFGIGTDFSKLNSLPEGKEDQLVTFSLPSTSLLGTAATIESVLNFVEGFGTTRTLSSPRIMAMNNQNAILTFAENRVFFNIDITRDAGTTTNGTTTPAFINVSSNPQTIPIGVLLNIQPSIDLGRDEVIMNVRPTITRVKGTVEDPGTAMYLAQLKQEGEDVSGLENIKNEYPIVDVREMDSVLRMKSGQVMVIGGLMDERSENDDRGIPGVSRIPVVGNAFKSVAKESSIVETVIFLKATIVPGSGVSVEDQHFYNKFSNDRRPLSFDGSAVLKNDNNN